MFMSSTKPRFSSLKRLDLKRFFRLKVKELELPKSLPLEEFKKVTQRIHLDSPLFEGDFLVRLFYSECTNLELQPGLSRLSDTSIQEQTNKRNIIFFYEDDFFLTKRRLKKIHQDTIKNESKKDAGVTFTLRNRLRQIKLDLDQVAVPLIKKKQESEEFKRMLNIFQKYWVILQLPIQLNNFFLHKDMKNLALLYKKHSVFLRKLSEQPFFAKVYEETNKIVSQAQKEIFEIISSKTKKFEAINDYIHLLFNLNVEQDPIHELIQKISKKIVKLIEYEFPNSILEDKYIPGAGPEGVSTFYNKQRKNLVKEGVLDIHEEGHDEEEEEGLAKILSSDGDLLLNFIQEVNLSEDSKSYYNRAKFEAFFQDFFQRMENIALVCKAYLKGNYDIQLKEVVADIEDIKEKVIKNFFIFYNSFLIKKKSSLKNFKNFFKNSEKAISRISSMIFSHLSLNSVVNISRGSRLVLLRSRSIRLY
jgi:REP element-mobilizing transposase RayT